MATEERTFSGLLQNDHLVRDRRSKEIAINTLSGWVRTELLERGWIQQLEAGRTIIIAEMSARGDGEYSHKKEFWHGTHFIFADADNIVGVEKKTDGGEKNPEGVQPWTEEKGLSKLYPNLKDTAFAVGQSVSSMADWLEIPHRRYRLVFRFDKQIRTIEEYHHVLLKIANQFPIIPAVERSPAQPVFGNAREGFNKFAIPGNILKLDDYLSDYTPPEQKRKKQQPTFDAPSETLEEFLRRHGITYDYSDDRSKLYVVCPYCSGHTGGKQGPTDSYVFDDGSGWAFYCSHAHCADKRTWDAFKRGHKIEAKTTKVYESEDGKYVTTEDTPTLEPKLENPPPVFPDDVFIGGMEHLLEAYKGSRMCKPFIFAMGITAIGVVVGRKAFLTTEEDTRASAPDYPNMYTLIIGQTMAAAKSETRGILEGILEFVHEQDTVMTPYRYINSVSSREGLAIDLRTDGADDDFDWTEGDFPEGIRALVSLDETKHLLDNSRREVTKNIVSDFNDLWRCPRSNNVRTRQNPIGVDYPVVSIFGCSTIKWLEDGVVGSDIDGGFINRFQPFFFERMPYIKKPKIDIDGYSEFVSRLSGLLPTPDSARHFLFTDEAYEAYHDWAEPLYNYAVENPDDAAITARTCDHARRIALCLALISNELDDNEVSVEVLQAAQKVAEYLADVARYVFKNVTASKDAEIERKVLDLLAQMGNEAKISELLTKFPGRDRPAAKLFHQIIDGLVFSGQVEVILARPKVIRRIA